MKYLGSHISLAAPSYFLGAVNEALSYGETTFMFYTGAPQNTMRKPLEALHIAEGLAKMKEAGMDPAKLVVHAPYIINLANKSKEDSFAFAKSFLEEELRRTAAFGAKCLVLHPGSHVGNGLEYGMESLLEGLDDVLSHDGTDVILCLETMAGKGSEIGTDFGFFKEVFAKAKYPDRLGVCLDTCHVHDAGYDVRDASALLDEFDRIVGLDKLKVVHLNDSKNPRGAHKDRHENLGYGHIGFEALSSFIREPRLADLPIVLETPWIGEKAPYKEEIAMLREGKLLPDWRDSFLTQKE